MDIMMVKQADGRLCPAYDSDHDKLRKIKSGEPILCKISQPRNILFHRKYFALMKLVLDNQELYTDLNDLRNDLTIEAGFYTERINMYGETVKKADSISFGNMDEHTFNDLYNRTTDVVVRWLSIAKEDIAEQVLQYF